METLTSIDSDLAPSSACRRRAVLCACGFCLLFFGLTTLYCYVYAYFFIEQYQASFASALSCVSRDWLLWLVSSPVLAHLCVQIDISSRSGRAAVVKLLVFYTFAMGATRMAAEYYWGSGTLAEVLLIYLPRYLFVTALVILAGVFYVFKTESESRIRCLERSFAQPPAQVACEPVAQAPVQTLVAYKGQSRVLVQVSDINCVTASGNYVELETGKGCFLLRSTMKEIESQLCSEDFIRVHRSHIVSLSALESVCCSRLEAKLRNGRVVRLGKTYMQALPHLSDSA